MIRRGQGRKAQQNGPQGPRGFPHPRAPPCGSPGVFQAVGFVREESCPTQAVRPLVGLAADKVIRDRYTLSR
ncbi:MAG: hypothetical protein ACQESR_06865 [Planctomycetota bacterium]